jgi:hypothetical protein
MIIYTFICTTFCNSGTTLWNSGEKRKEKRMMGVNNIEIHYISAGRGHNDMY